MTSTPRSEPAQSVDERATLTEFLDYYRATLLRQAEGLTDDQLRTVVAPSTMTLGGLLSHLAWVESWWFDTVLDGNEPPEPWASADWENDDDAEWTMAATMTGDDLRALFTRSAERSRSQIAHRDLDELSVKRSRHTDQPCSVRYILVHMIEEYARHCGHADLLREHIDGTTDL